MTIKILILAIAPTVAYVFWTYLKDKYDKEPIHQLGKFFIIGVFISIIALMIEWILLKVDKLHGYNQYLYLSFIVAGLTEEGLKALVLIPNLLREKNFNERLDGIIYSIFLSLGFATMENILYLISEDKNLAYKLILIRAVISIPAHMLFAITMGDYISKYKFACNKLKKREYIVLAVLVPVLMHGFFDFILMIEYRWSIILFLIYTIYLWKINLDKLEKYIINSKKRFKKAIIKKINSKNNKR